MEWVCFKEFLSGQILGDLLVRGIFLTLNYMIFVRIWRLVYLGSNCSKRIFEYFMCVINIYSLVRP